MGGLQLQKRGTKSDGGDKRLIRLLQKDLFPYIGSLPVSQITSPDLLRALRRIEQKCPILGQIESICCGCRLSHKERPVLILYG